MILVAYNRLIRKDMQLSPFYFIQEISNHTSAILTKPATYFYLLKESAFLQVAFNVLLTVPFGVYLRYYFRRSFLQTVCISFCLSLFFELTQVTGLYGIYNCAYRLFDIDDLFLNTLGGCNWFYHCTNIYVLPSENKRIR